MSNFVFFSFFFFPSNNSNYKFNAFIKVIIDTKLGSRSVTFTLQKPFTMLWYLPIIDLIDLRLKQLILQFYLTNLRNYVRFL